MIPRRSLAPLALRPGLRPSLALRPCLALAIRNRIDAGFGRVPASRVWETTTAATPETIDAPPPESGDTSGRIAVHSNESILFFESMIKVSTSDPM